MKNKIVFILLFLVVFCITCKPTGVCNLKIIEHLAVRAEGEVRDYFGTISRSSIKNSITFEEKVPCGIGRMVITDIKIYEPASTSNKGMGDYLEVDKNNIITITACDGTTQNYTVLIESETCSGNGLVLGRK